MGTSRIAGWLLTGLAIAAPTSAHPGRSVGGPGSLVGVEVEVAGRPAPLYPSPDGSGRYYLEAREGCRYSVRLSNRTTERVGVVLTVDGLNAISGERDRGRGRMYVLDPWQHATIHGWRTSLQEVRRFTFVDEEVSYAARSGKANPRMGWIEVSVYRERRPSPRRLHLRDDEARGSADRAEEAGERSGRAESAPSAPEPAPEGEARAHAKRSPQTRSYPGTGWGPKAHDPVVLVDFRPQRSPAERTTLRYEYRGALVALGVLPSPHVPHGRLWEREHGESGFAPPPLW
jgi:hypothetical protein